MLRKLITLLIIGVLFPFKMYGEEHVKFSQLMCQIISQSQTVEDCTYDNEKQIIEVYSPKGGNKKILCLWFAQNEKNEVVIEAKNMSLKRDVDYILIGYGQNPTNPRLYYYIPSNKVGQKVKLNKLKEYLLTWPIVLNQF